MTGACPGKPFFGEEGVADWQSKRQRAAHALRRPLVKLGGVSKKPGSICICAQPKRAEGAISTLCDDGRLRTLL